MRTLVIYDIRKDKLRNKVAEACKDYGLERIQFSAFIGEMDHNNREELALRLRRTVGKAVANVQLYPMCDKDLRLKVEIQGKSSPVLEA